jgi:hypothetical protein
VRDFQGCEIHRDREARVMNMTRSKKIDDMAKEYGMDESVKTVSTPMGTDFVQTKFPHSTVDGGVSGSGSPLEPGHRFC